MIDKQSEFSTLDEFIVQTIKRNRPSNVEQLVNLVLVNYKMPKEKIVERIVSLQDKGKIVFRESPTTSIPSLTRYLLSAKTIWYWIVMSLSLCTIGSVIAISDTAYPIVYARMILGFIFILLFPGYALTKALFPKKELENMERAALSIGISLFLVPMVGLLLNYTILGIQTSIVIILLALTAAFATIGVLREYKVKTDETR